MEVELVKKYVIIAMRYCYRYASRHPLLVFMVFVLIWMYRSFPLLFFLLIRASPVIASTSILLGTLLFFGHKNAPEIRKERKPDHHDQIFNFKTRVMSDTEIGERDVKNAVHEKAFGKNTFVVNNDRRRVDINKFGNSIDSNVLRADKKVNQESNSVVGNQKTDLCDERVVFMNRLAQFQPLETKTNGSRSGGKLGGDLNRSIDHHLEGVEKFQHRHEDIRGWETGSELAETSSPTASMTEIFSMLDGVHPLLESEVPHQHVHMSNVSTDVTSDDYDDDDDQEDIEEEEEEVNVNEKEDADVITWTEDDHKNLMNLGTSELERNERLEHLVARQKALKKMRMLAERNMVSIAADLPLNSPHISTARKNPFDLPYDHNANIVGSAPSSTIPKRNPFDLQHDQHFKNPDPAITASFQPNFIALPPHDQVSHRRKSFDVGPSALGSYFVPEQIASEATSYSLMHRGMGGLSDSRVNFMRDTESIDSAQNHDDHSPEADTFSIKGGSIASARTEDYHAREADLNSIKEGYCTSEVSEHVSRSSDDEDTLKLGQHPKLDDRLDEFKKSGVDETGYQGKSSSESSSSSFSDVPDHVDDDEDEFRSAVMPLTPNSKESQIQEHGKQVSPNFNSTSTAEPAYSSVDNSGYNSDATKHDDQIEHDDHSEIDNTEEPGFPQRLTQMQQGLTSWFGWKA